MLFTFLLTNSCENLRNDWTRDGYVGRTYQKIAVVGISYSVDERKLYEEDAVERLNRQGFAAIEGMDVLPDGLSADELNPDRLIARLKDQAVDGILTISVSLQDNEPFNITTIGYGEFGKFYSRRYAEVHTLGYATAKKYVVEAFFFELTASDSSSQSRLVWKGEMAILKPKGNTSAKERFVRRVINTLVDEKVILKQ